MATCFATPSAAYCQWVVAYLDDATDAYSFLLNCGNPKALAVYLDTSETHTLQNLFQDWRHPSCLLSDLYRRPVFVNSLEHTLVITKRLLTIRPTLATHPYGCGCELRGWNCPLLYLLARELTPPRHGSRKATRTITSLVKSLLSCNASIDTVVGSSTPLSITRHSSLREVLLTAAADPEAHLCHCWSADSCYCVPLPRYPRHGLVQQLLLTARIETDEAPVLIRLVRNGRLAVLPGGECRWDFKQQCQRSPWLKYGFSPNSAPQCLFRASEACRAQGRNVVTEELVGVPMDLVDLIASYWLQSIPAHWLTRLRSSRERSHRAICH